MQSLANSGHRDESWVALIVIYKQGCINLTIQTPHFIRLKPTRYLPFDSQTLNDK